MQVKILTLFDCTLTGVTGHYRAGRLPFTDQAGQTVTNESEWIKSRNQQRNYETLLQLIGLFTQPMNISQPIMDQHTGFWSFDFETDFESIFEMDNDSLGLLKKHANGVPMIVGLGEQKTDICTLTPDVNIRFETMEIGK